MMVKERVLSYRKNAEEQDCAKASAKKIISSEILEGKSEKGLNGAEPRARMGTCFRPYAVESSGAAKRRQWEESR